MLQTLPMDLDYAHWSSVFCLRHRVLCAAAPPRDLDPPVGVSTLRQGGWLNAVEQGIKDPGVTPSITGTGVTCL